MRPSPTTGLRRRSGEAQIGNRPYAVFSRRLAIVRLAAIRGEGVESRKRTADVADGMTVLRSPALLRFRPVQCPTPGGLNRQ